MSFRVNAEELVTQKVTMEHVASVETVFQPWRQNSSHHKKLWRKLYSQNAQESNVKTVFKTTVANNSTVKDIIFLFSLKSRDSNTLLSVLFTPTLLYRAGPYMIVTVFMKGVNYGT